MYQLAVPFMLEQIELYGAEPFLAKLKEIGADSVFLALDGYVLDRAKQKKIFAALSENVPRFQRAGFTVGVWICAFMLKEQNSYVHITSPGGKISQVQVCPSDKDFCDFVYKYLQNMAKSNPDLILFDDDFRYGYLDCGLGCACKNHRATMEALLGETLPAGDLSGQIFSGGRNKYRSAFLSANGHHLKEFARLSREAVDSVNPDIRLGICSCMTTWDFDGVSAIELAKILAGETKPFCRLIGAPYWAARYAWENRLQDVIELERMESSWSDGGVELLAEGDCWPRPRFTCAANVLEGFDMAIRASGATDGILKYVLDYHSDVDYESTYAKKHLQNQAIYRQIDRLFGDKAAVGVRVYENMTKFEDMDIPFYYEGKDSVTDVFFSAAARLLAAQTIPTAYEGLGTVGIAFGENAKYLPQEALDHGLILDLSAASILEKAGVDVGLASLGELYTPTREYFPARARYVSVYHGKPTPELHTKKEAVIHSFFTDGEREVIASYSYENARGQKFLVFAFDGYHMSEHNFKQSARGEQIEEWIASLGRCLPASVHGNPDCYILCKESNTEKAVWIGNFFADECVNTTVILNKPYREIEFINCSGVLQGDRVMLDGIAPWASVGFAVR